VHGESPQYNIAMAESHIVQNELDKALDYAHSVALDDNNPKIDEYII